MSADQLARALEDAISSLTYIANTACKRDEELMSDAINVRGYARSRATAAEQALAAHRAQADKQGEAEPLFWYRPCRDGLYEGPVHHKSVGGTMLRAEKPGEWFPLYASQHQVAQPLTDEQIEALAHRIAWRYKKSSDPHHSDTYTFNRDTLIQFAAAIGKEVQG